MLAHICCNTRRMLHQAVQELGYVRTTKERFKVGRQGRLAKATQELRMLLPTDMSVPLPLQSATGRQANAGQCNAGALWM